MPTPNRLLILAVDFLPRIGGISVMTHHLANALCDTGLDTVVVAPKGACVPEGLHHAYRLHEDLQARPAARSGQEAYVEDRRIAALLDAIRNEFAYERILLAHPFYYGFPALRYAKRQGVALSALFYGFELRSQLVAGHLFRDFASRLLGGGQTLRHRTLEIARRADQLLPISNYTADLLRSTGTRRPIHVTGCGICQEDFERELRLTPVYSVEEKRSRRALLGLPDNQVVGFVGRLVESKNVAFLLRVLTYLPEVHAVIVGTGPQEAALKAAAKELAISNRVHWVGSVSEEQKWAYLRSIDVFCLFSKEMPEGQVEGFGIVLLEAAAAGSPAVAARSGGMTDVILDGRTGFLCEPDNLSEAAHKIRALLSDPELAAQFVAGARTQITERFNWRSIAEALRRTWQT